MNRIKIAAAWVRTHVPPLYVILAGLFVAWFSTAIRAHRTETQLDSLRAKYDGAAAVQVVQVHDAQGHKLGAALVPQRAGDFFVSPTAASPFAIKDGSGVTRDTFETAHGRITAGGGGSDYYAEMGPYPGFETADAAFWLLPHGTTASGSNVTLAGDGANLTINTVSSVGAFNFNFGNSITGGKWSASTFRLGGTSTTAPLDFDWTTIAAPTLQSGSAATSFSILTAAGATLQLQGGNSTGATNITGSLAYTTRTVTASFTIDTTTTDRTIAADTTSAAITVTLPTPTEGRHLYLIDPKGTWGTHNVTLAPHGSELIDNAPSGKILNTANSRCTIDEVGGNWFTRC